MLDCVTGHHDFVIGHNPHSVYITCKTCTKHASWLVRHYRNSNPDFSVYPHGVMHDLMGRWTRITGRQCWRGPDSADKPKKPSKGD